MKKLTFVIALIFIGCSSKNIINEKIKQYQLQQNKKENTLQRADKEWEKLDKEKY